MSKPKPSKIIFCADCGKPVLTITHKKYCEGCADKRLKKSLKKSHHKYYLRTRKTPRRIGKLTNTEKVQLAILRSSNLRTRRKGIKTNSHLVERKKSDYYHLEK